MAELISAGPTSFATEGERQAAILLQQHLPSDWIIICNKIVTTSNGHSFEIDFIILARCWIFLLDEKSWKGRISGNDLQWIRADGSATKSPLNQIDFNAKVVAGQIKYRVTPLNQNGHFVRGGILLSMQEHLPQIHDPRAASNVFLLSDVCQRLLKLDSFEGNPLVGQLQEKVKQALVRFPDRPQVPRQIQLFKIEDVISSPRPNVRIFDASVEGDTEEKRQLMVYDLDKDPLAAQQLSDFYKQEYRAIKKLQSTGLVPEAQDPFIWSEDYLVVVITPPGGKALKAWPLPETREEFLQEVQFASICFKALDQIHASGIIHRALGPEALYVQSMQPPKVMFTNFYAARTGTNTIAPSLDALSIEDPYASIDVAIGYEFASTITDTYSLVLILLERLSGLSIKSLRPNIDDHIVIPDQPRWSSFLTAEQAEELVAILQSIIQPENGARPLPAKDIATRLTELARHARTNVTGEVGTILCKRYQVQRLLGQGMMAKTYLVKDTSFAELGSYVLKQFIHIDEGARQQAIAEYKALKDLSSKYIPRIEYIFPLEEDAHILMQYIPGLTLQQVESEFPWSLERWWEFAQHLLNAIDVLEQKTFLHRDIKPANIILHEEDNRPVLIDFGFAIQRGIKGHIAGTPLYLPPETLSSEQTPYSADRYAAAIVLFKALTDMLPFTIASDGVRTVLSLETFEDQTVRRIATVLQKAVSNNPGERPDSVNQLHNELQIALLAVEEPPPVQELQAKYNVWVDNIRSLYQNSDAGNANNRGLDSDFVRDTYVPTMLDQQLVPLLFEHLPRALFLSGNPGDGKTAFLEQVYLELQRRQATVVHKDASGWEVTYKGHTFRSCYDASESHQQQSADEQLSEKLHGLDGQQPTRTDLTVLIAINDGRLFDFFQQQRARFPWLAHQIDLATEEEENENQPVWLIDMKKRAFVGLPEADEPSIFSHILSSFVAPDKWTICEQCVAQTVCPLRNNAQALHKKKIAVRLEYLFLLTHLRRLSHITMRDLRSALTYLITGNKSCQDIHQMRSGAEIGSSLINLAYWQNTFTHTDTRDELLNNLTSLDPARFPRPHLDRFLHFHQTPDDAEQRRLLFTDKQDLPSRRFKDSTEWIAAVKRRLYFEAGKPDPESNLPFVGWNLLLPYRFANKFWQLLDKRINSEKIIEKLALGILRSDEVWEEIPPGAMSIKVNSSDAQQLVVLKQIPLPEFELLVPYQLNTQMIETLPEILMLQHKTGTPRLEITLDLFELLMQMADGLQPDAHEYEPLLEDLKLFKNALLLQETQDLILVESQFHIHRIVQRDGKIIRQTI